MEELRIISFIAALFQGNPALMVAMFGWVVTLVVWQRSEKYHRGQYQVIGDRHDQERKDFVGAIRDMKATMCSMRDIMIKLEARL